MRMYLAAVMVAMMVLTGCAGATRRANQRAESHVKYHAAKQLDCEESSLTATCVNAYRSGECYQYEVVGCDRSIVYQNSYGSGWTSGS